MTDKDFDPYTEQAAERLENGFQDACGGLAIDIAEVRESIDDELVKEVLKQSEYCLNTAGKLWNDRHGNKFHNITIGDGVLIRGEIYVIGDIEERFPDYDTGWVDIIKTGKDTYEHVITQNDVIVDDTTNVIWDIDYIDIDGEVGKIELTLSDKNE